MTKLFFVMYLNIAILTILMYGEVEEIDLPDYFPILKGRYKRFNVSWYERVGSTIMVSMILQIFMPHFAGLGK